MNIFKNKSKKSIKRKVLSLVATLAMTAGFAGQALADSGEVVTLGANLNASQKQAILNYFGVDEANSNIIYVNNQQERKYLGGIAPEAQIGRVTMSSSYVVPTTSGGINVKTSNITWVTSSMIASTLATAGVENANVVAAAPFPVSGTGALTGITMAFEKSSGEKLTEEKKKLANKELITTGNLAESVGKDKAAGIINDTKKEVIKKDMDSEKEIKDTVKKVANNYNVTLNTGDINIITNLMKDVGNQNYNYNDMKDTLNNVSANVKNNLSKAGEKIESSGIIDKASSWLKNNKDASSFFNKFDDSKLSKNAVVSTTSTGLEEAKKAAGDLADKAQKSGLLDRIIEFINSFFN
ncbi:DUF1002 domain-containing protein [Peptostreptococcus stomatis]